MPASSAGWPALPSGAVAPKVTTFPSEAIRNTPLLLQLFFWNATLQALPGARQAMAPLPGIYLCNRGIFFQTLTLSDNAVEFAYIGLAAAIVFGALLFVRPLRERPFLRRKVAYLGLIGFALLAVIAAILGGAGLAVPERHGFNFAGGSSLSPEFSALVIGLVINAAAGIAEIVRSGIESVSQGQWEAAGAVGLRRGQVMRLVVLPQALRVIIPSFVNLGIGLFLDTTLVIVIGLFDFLNTAKVAATDPNWLGYHDEAYLFAALVYFTICFGGSRYSLWLEARLARRPGAKTAKRQTKVA
jgi:general L-amino acid transport system permease protein